MTHARIFGDDTVSFDEHDVFFLFNSVSNICFFIIIIAAELINKI